MGEWFSQPVRVFRSARIPEPAVPAGYSALMERFELPVSLPTILTPVAERHHPQSSQSWQLLTPRHRPADTLEGQLLFALKWEGVDLAVLAALFKAVEPADIAATVRATPTGGFARRIWFLYEWLTGGELDIADPGKVRAVNVVNPEQQVALQKGIPSLRHKVIDNLPGTCGFSVR